MLFVSELTLVRGMNCENDPPSSSGNNSVEIEGNGCGNNANNGKGLLTQEFNTVSLVSSSSASTTLYSADSAPVIFSPSDIGNSHIPVQTVLYPTQAFTLIPTATTQVSNNQQPYYMMIPSFQQYANIHSNKASKRIKLTETPHPHQSTQITPAFLCEQVNNLKVGFKSSYDLNLQKIEELVQIAQNLQTRGSVKLDSLKASLELLNAARTLFKEIYDERVNMTAAISSELMNTMLPEVLKLLKCNYPCTNSKVELVEKLRKEEDSHLADLTILSTRNRELQKDQHALKDQLERLQLEYSDSLSLAARQKEDYEHFLKQIRLILGIEPTDISQQLSSQITLLDKIESLLNEREGLKEIKNELEGAMLNLYALKQEILDLFPYTSATNDPLMLDLINLICEKFEEISQSRERFFNDCLNSLNRKFDQLSKLQHELTHKSLGLRVNLQSQLSDSHEIIARLRRHCQELTVEVNAKTAEVEKKRLTLQVKESESNEYKRKYEVSQERLKLLEQELSMKNQENRTFAIRIQGLEGELEETRVQNRHDISSLERKISILESKLGGEEIRCDSSVVDNLKKMQKMQEFVDLDPFSSVEAARENKENKESKEIKESKRVIVLDTSVTENGITGVNIIHNTHINQQSHSHSHTLADVSVIPPTVPAPSNKRNYMITFTGIRDPQKQKELTGLLHELGAIVHVGADFNDDITHVLTPRGYKSIRVLAASLTGKWIVPLEWVEACNRAGCFVPESLVKGYNNTSIRPFRFRTLWMSAAFSATHKSHPVYPVAALRTLLEKLGKARWTETQGQADFLLVTEEEKESKLITSNRGILLTLSNLIDMIPIE